MDETVVRTSSPVVEAVQSDSPAVAPGATSVIADFEAKLREVLERVRPFLQMDGGDIELVAVEDRNAVVRLHGACQSCSISTQTMTLGVEQAIRRDIPDFGELIQID